MSRKQFVSVIITAYNYATWLPRCLGSALAQEYPANCREIFVIDDGSTDQTQAVLHGYSDRIRMLRQANRGQAAAIQTALESTTGEIVAFLDPDDEWYPSKLQQCVAEFEDPQVGMVQHQMDVEEQGKRTSRRLHNKLSHGSPGSEALTYRYHYMPTSALLFRRSVLERILPLPVVLRTGGSDSYMAVCAGVISRIAAIEKPLGLYRLHGENAFTGNLSRPALEAQLQVVEEVFTGASQLALRNGVQLPKNFDSFRFADYPVLRKIELAHLTGRSRIPRLWLDYMTRYALPEYGFSLLLLQQAVRMLGHCILPPRQYAGVRRFVRGER